jgi:two-component system phosphate regulon sensor histidine kinase PhoR
MGTLTGRIFRSIFLISLAVVLAAGVLFAGLAYAVLDNQLRRELLNTSDIIASTLPVAGDEADYLKGLALRDIRLTWIAADGSVLYDSVATDTTEIANHLDRPEVQEALRAGSGVAARHSQTLDEETVYLARLLPDGTVLRVAGTQRSILGHMGAVLLPGVLALLVVAIAAAVVARLTARRMLKPLGVIDFEQPLENDTYPELAPLLARLDASRQEIAERNAQLDARRGEFDVVTGSMREGLVLADAQGRILFINAAAAALFEASPDGVVGRHLLTLNRNDRIQHVVDRALLGERAEGHFEQDGRVYRLLASPVFTGDEASGAALLVLDITEWYRADTQRREFTANVSHELKTPLTVINGYAELMEQGMVAPKDRARFTRLIHDEATRLIALVDDIITLSQLDEGEGGAPWSSAFERVDLVALVREVADRLTSFAQGREVRLILSPTDDSGASDDVAGGAGSGVSDDVAGGAGSGVDGERKGGLDEAGVVGGDEVAGDGVDGEREGGEDDIAILGIPALLSRMIYNLIENGIRYTNSGGQVVVAVARRDGAALVSVCDSGIGIPAEFHDKVFERFFCVDRSRSRETGGTGLGLAIVKHGALVHDAEIHLTSAPNTGTTLELHFPHFVL